MSLNALHKHLAGEKNEHSCGEEYSHVAGPLFVVNYIFPLLLPIARLLQKKNKKNNPSSVALKFLTFACILLF